MYISSATTFNFLFKVFSLRFHFETCNKKAKSCWTLTGQCSIFVRFCPSEHLFLLLNPHGGFPIPCFSWNSPAVAWAALFSFFHKTCLILTMFRPSWHQRPLRSSFAPMTRGTSHLVLPHRGTVHRGGHQIIKAQVRQCSGQPAQASPSGHFRNSRCLQ